MAGPMTVRVPLTIPCSVAANPSSCVSRTILNNHFPQPPILTAMASHFPLPALPPHRGSTCLMCPMTSIHPLVTSHLPHGTKSQPPQAFWVPQYAHLCLLGTPPPTPPALRSSSVPPGLPMSLWTPQMHSQTSTSQAVEFSFSVLLGNPQPTATCSSFFLSIFLGPVNPRNLIVGRPFPL